MFDIIRNTQLVNGKNTEETSNKLSRLSAKDIDNLVFEYRQIVLNPKVTCKGEARLEQIMQLAVSHEQLASAINEVDLKIGVAIGVIPPRRAKASATTQVES